MVTNQTEAGKGSSPAWTQGVLCRESRQDRGLASPSGTWWEPEDVSKHSWMGKQDPDGDINSKWVRRDAPRPVRRLPQ